LHAVLDAWQTWHAGKWKLTKHDCCSKEARKAAAEAHAELLVANAPNL
jgi:hypothetical protein